MTADPAAPPGASEPPAGRTVVTTSAPPDVATAITGQAGWTWSRSVWGSSQVETDNAHAVGSMLAKLRRAGHAATAAPVLPAAVVDDARRLVSIGAARRKVAEAEAALGRLVGSGGQRELALFAALSGAGVSQSEIARMAGCDRVWVHRRLKLVGADR